MWQNEAARQGVTSTLPRLTTDTMIGASIMAKGHLPAGRVLFQCKGCQLHLDADAFYVSNPGRCKECVKAMVRKNRLDKIDYYRNFDRKRYREQPKRKAAAKASTSSEARVRAQRAYKERLRRLHPEKIEARTILNNALRDGRISRGEACFFCGETHRLQAHHPDYTRPLDVFWLCQRCHGKLHTVVGDFLRGAA